MCTLVMGAPGLPAFEAVETRYVGPIIDHTHRPAVFTNRASVPKAGILPLIVIVFDQFSHLEPPRLAARLRITAQTSSVYR